MLASPRAAVTTLVSASRLRAAVAPALAAAILCAAAAASPAGAQRTARAAGVPQAAIDSIAASALAATSTPGMSIVVMRGATVVAAKGYGMADRERGTRATSRTVYQLGSISKQFTAAGIMRLIERLRLHADDPVSRHLPEYTPVGDSVRIRHLLHQTSGIREEFTIPGYAEGIADTTRPYADLLELIMGEPLDFAPGSRWAYSNSNYTLLAAIIERTMRMPYERYLAESFFGPLGLASLHHCTPRPTAPHHARGYVMEEGRIAPAPLENMHWIRGDGGLCGSAEDLARWARALAAGRAVSPASYRLMTAPRRLGDGVTPAYGYALSTVPLDGRHRRVSHGGRMAGFTGTIAHYPEQDVTIAVLANRGGLWIESVEQAIARRVLGLPRPRVRDAIVGPVEWSAYAGTYDIGVHGFSIRIVERDGRLWMEAPPPAPSSRLLHQGNGRFAASLEPDAVQVTFVRAEDAERAERMVLLMAGMRWYGRRIE